MGRFPEMGVQAVVGGYREFINEVGGMGKAVQASHSQMSRMGTLSLGSLVKGVGAVATGVIAIGTAAVGAGLAIGTLAFKIAEAAVPMYEMRDAFEIFAKRAGKTGEEVLKVWQEATRGTVPAIKLMQMYNDAVRLLGETAAKKIPSFLPLLMKASDAAGMELTDFSNILYKAIRRTNAGLLSQIGVMIDGQDLFEKYAKSIGKTADELTLQQKQTLLLNESLKQLKEETKDLPDAATGASAPFGRLTAAITDAKNEISMAFVPAMLPLVTALGELARQYLPQIVTWFNGKIIPALGKMAGIIAGRLPNSLGKLSNTWEHVRAVIGMFVRYWQTSLYPSLKNLWGILMKGLVPIVKILYNVWSKVKGAFSGLGKTILANLLPALVPLVNRIGEFVGKYLPPLVDFITAKVIPALTALATWIGEKLIDAIDWLTPYFDKLVLWMQNEMPGAITTLGGWWDTLKVKFGELAIFWKETLWPAILDIYTWFSTNLPIAIGILQGWWDTLKTKVGEFVTYWQGTLWPAIQEVAGYIAEKLSPIVRILAMAWESYLLPALTAVWQFVSTVLWPVLFGLGSVVFAALSKAVEAFWLFWVNILLPALEKVWSFLSVYLKPMFDGLSGAINSVSLLLEPFVEWLGKVTESLDSWELPEWLQGHSPSPFEKSLWNIRDTLLEINAIGMPGGGRMSPVVAGPGGGGGGGGDTFSPAYNLAIHTSAPRENIAADFGMMQALSRRR